MIRLHEVKDRVNIQGSIEGVSLSENTLVIGEKGLVDRFFYVVEDNQALEGDNLKSRFFKGDSITVIDGVVRKITRVIYDESEE